jgi:ABC-2 type transport system ATP-binding protein
MSEAAVEIRDLIKRYKDKVAVDGISLEVERGSIVAILGPNGAGKTTTIECCEGYRRPDQGTVRVLGLDPWREGAALRPRVGVMLQNGGVYPGARADEMVRHFGSLHAHPVDPNLLIDRLGLESAGRTPYRQLSGGQQKRLALALAVVGRPEVVFLDEPSAGLDPQGRLATWELVRELKRDGVSVVLTTHLMDEAERLSDRVFIIDRGRVVTSGRPEELSRTGAGDSVRFRGPGGLDLASLLARLPAGATAREVSPGSYVVEGVTGPQALAACTAWFAEQGFMPEDLLVGRRSLEDVFLELTGRGRE